jgi:hypothetical protein
MFSFDAMLGYSEHSDGELSIFNLLSGLRFNLPWYDRVVPYAILGLGFYRPSYKDQGTPGQSSHTNQQYINPFLFGLHLGPGLDLQVSQNIYFGAGLTFHNMFSMKKKYSSGEVFSAGGVYTSFLLNAGISFMGW